MGEHLIDRLSLGELRAICFALQVNLPKSLKCKQDVVRFLARGLILVWKPSGNLGDRTVPRDSLFLPSRNTSSHEPTENDPSFERPDEN